MKGILGIVFGVIMFFVVLFIATNIEKVPAGHVGVKVYLLGTDKGVDTEELTPGRYWIGINEELYLFPTFANNYVWTQSEDEGSPEDESLVFQSVEGMNVEADVGITYRVDPTKVSVLFQRYRKGIEEITDTYLRNMVRDALVTETSTMGVRSIYGDGKAELLKRAEEMVRAQVSDFGIIVERIYWIGGLRLPDSVQQAIGDEISATAKARQRENEIKQAEAEAQKARAKARGVADARLIEAKAEAEANRILAESLSPSLTAYIATTRWNGELPYVTGSGGTLPMIQLPELEKGKPPPR